jgi:hypothetical protein
MGQIHVGLNSEFSRSSDKPFEWAVQRAAEMGYKHFEPDEGIKARWTSEEEDFVLIMYALQEAAFIAERLVHLHAKDISVSHSQAERGKVTGTPVGCACGEGVLDWARIIAIVARQCPRDIVFSVECGTPAQAAKSLAHLAPLVRR